MNNSNSTMGNRPDLVSAAVFGCIMLIGLPLNAVSLWILLRQHSLKSPNAVFMVNLAISDLLLVISLPMRVYFHATGTWPLDSITCLIINMLFRGNVRSSAIFITFISVDRLLAVVYPLRSRHLRTSSNAWKGAVLAWLLVMLWSIPQGVNFLKQYDSHTCFKPLPKSNKPDDGENLKSILYVFFLVFVATMLAVNIVCTVIVSWTLRSHLSASMKIKNKVNVMLIFAMNLVLFAVCFLPLPVYLVQKYTTNINPLICLTAVNCCLDPLLYYFSFDGFWKKKEDMDLSREL